MFKCRKSLVITLILTLTAIKVLQFRPAFANIPSVDTPVPWTSGTHTMLNITIHHDTTALPFPDHYISQVEVDVDGTPNIIPLTNSPPQPQYSFIIQYDMGVVAGTPTVQAKAYCTYHFWGSLSPSIQIPEFSMVQLLPIIAIISIAILLLRPKVSNSKKLQKTDSAIR